MGLDMYLSRMPRYKDVTPGEIDIIESYFSWLDAKDRGSEYAQGSFKDWCGHDESELPDNDAIDFFRSYYVARFGAWDTEKKYPYYHIMEEVGYWRKANEIHAWFVNHMQDGEDDCCYHDEVTKEDLEELRDTCIEVLEKSVMMLGQVKNGATLIDGEWVDNLEPGKVIINPAVAEELLPTQSGFFFGGTDYDEWYVRDLQYTVKMINEVLATTDFETQMLYYCSSW